MNTHTWNTSRLVAAFGLLALAGGCSSPIANPNITTSVGVPPVSAPIGQGVAIECEGETGSLGLLCGYVSTNDAWWRADSGAEYGVALGPDGGPYLVVLGFVPELSASDQADEISYSVYLVNAPRTGSMPEQIARWVEGVSLDGEVMTERARGAGCSGETWIAGGTLESGGTTIRFAMRASSPC